MFALVADPGDPRAGFLPDRDGRGQLLERLHLPDSLAKERHLAGLALSRAAYRAIAARDNIPIVSWIALRGECRDVRLPDLGAISPGRSPGRLAVPGRLLVDVIAGPRGAWGQVPAFQLVAAAYHAMFLALLVAATFIDYDLMIIPDQITVTGMVSASGWGRSGPRFGPCRHPGRDHALARLLGRRVRAWWSARA